MRELTFETYVNASKAEDAYKYYKSIFGEETDLLLSYHLKYKTNYGVTDDFKVVRDINDMTWGQFVSAEIILSNTEIDRVDMAVALANTVIRPINEVIFSNDNEAEEKEHEKAILKYDARSIIEEVEKYIKLRDDFIKNKYRGVFYMVDRENKELKEEDVSGKNKEQDEFIAQWYWYAITRDLAEENVVINTDSKLSKLENALNTKMSAIAPDIAYKRHKQILEEIEAKKQELKGI
jgi:hypothetical protein